MDAVTLEDLYQHDPLTAACMVRRTSGGWAAYQRDGHKVVRLMSAADEGGRYHNFPGAPDHAQQRISASHGNFWPVS